MLLMSIKPPSRVSRIPRSITLHTHYKAHEWSMWLLYYSPVILRNILPKQYFDHWMHLVKGISLLSKKSVEVYECDQAQEYFNSFSENILALYGDKQQTYNVHQLLHFPFFAKLYGPLQKFSMFPFENYNMTVSKYVKGSQYVTTQIAKRYLREIQLRFANTKGMASALFSKSSSNLTPTDFNGFLFQHEITSSRLSVETLNVLIGDSIQVKSSTFFSKLRTPYRKLFCSKHYTLSKKRNSYCALLMDNRVIVIDVFVCNTIDNVTKMYAVGKVHELQICFPSVTHILKSRQSYFACIECKDLKDVMLLVVDENDFYFCSFLNDVENYAS